MRSSRCGSVVRNLTSIHEDVSSILGLAQWIKRSGIAWSDGVGWRGGLDLEWLWLWYRLVAEALIWPLAWKHPYASGGGGGGGGGKKKKKKVPMKNFKGEKISVSFSREAKLKRLSQNSQSTLFFLAAPMACRSSWARIKSGIIAVTGATARITPEP